MGGTGVYETKAVTEVEVFKALVDWRTRYADNRFKQLTLWFGAMTLLLTAGFHRDSGLSLEHHHLLVPLLGIFVTSAFWIMEVCSTLKEIEVLERLKPFLELIPGPKLNHWTFVNHTNVTLLLHLVSFVLWTILATLGHLNELVLLLVVAVGAALISFTIREYKHLWRDATQNWKP